LHQATAFNFSKKEAGFREQICPQKPASEKAFERSSIDHIAFSKIHLGG
jgi:hypothetical protein